MSVHSQSTGRSRQQIPTLSTILRLDPDKEPWCAGYAASLGRRCRVPKNSHSRIRAKGLLDEGTESLRAGEDIGDILDELAPHVLCTTFHQSQAANITAIWRKRVQAALERQSSPSVELPVAATSRSSRSVESIQSSRNASSSHSPRPAERSYVSNQQSSGSRVETQLPQATFHFSAFPRLNLSSTNGSRRSGIEIPIPNMRSRDIAARETAFHRDVAAIVQIAAAHEVVSQAHDSRTAGVQHAPRTLNSGRSSRNFTSSEPRLQSQDSSRPGLSATTSRQNSSRAVDTSQPRTAIQSHHVASPSESDPMRKPILGPCPICLEELQDSGDPAEKKNIPCGGDDASGKTQEGTSSDNNSSTRGNSTYEEGNSYSAHSRKKKETEITYCRAYCGNNFHLTCIQHWLGLNSNPTCPMCRYMWKN